MRAIFRNLVIALFGAVLSLGFYGQEAEAVLKGSSFTGGTLSSTTTFPDGTFALPSITFSSAGGDDGFFLSSNNIVGGSSAGAASFVFSNTQFQLNSGMALGWTAGTVPGSLDTAISRVSAQAVRFSATGATTASRTELNKAVTTISNAVATSVLTITIPNAAHSGTVMVRLTCSLGAGGVIGANEATATNSYMVSITRTAGVNATAAISAAYGAAATAVAGASTVTATAALAAVGGAVGATNTIDVQATVSRSASTSDNHTCLVYGQLMNANVTGITIS